MKPKPLTISCQALDAKVPTCLFKLLILNFPSLTHLFVLVKLFPVSGALSYSSSKTSSPRSSRGCFSLTLQVSAVMPPPTGHLPRAILSVSPFPATLYHGGLAGSFAALPTACNVFVIRVPSTLYCSIPAMSVGCLIVRYVSSA